MRKIFLVFAIFKIALTAFAYFSNHVDPETARTLYLVAISVALVSGVLETISYFANYIKIFKIPQEATATPHIELAGYLTISWLWTLAIVLMLYRWS